ncbi:hypothetical protein [Alicyclobacillus fodiniaquatilis]|jgi:hypothetical protein|uniref:YtpI-like protein n=1 Tax=Alicyclobacillus fodiniaquatilis TaxID=1661150 RepID=A0ABW4JL99_9BACL
MTYFLPIVQGVALYVTVLLGIFLYVAVLGRLQAVNNANHAQKRQATHLTLALVGVITMVFGVGCAHRLWPQVDGLWLSILGILIIAVAWLIYRLRRLSPKTN